MSKFKQLDVKLKAFAKKLRVEVAKSGTVYSPAPSVPIEERRIVWIEGRIGKGILIQPHVEPGIGVSSDLWDVINLAWLEDASYTDKSSAKPMWSRTIIRKGGMVLLEKEIDDLLFLSEENLKQIELRDLKKPRT